jgi:hypothetical protein
MRTTYLIAASLLISFVAYAKAPKDFNNSPEISKWFANAKQRNGGSCCGPGDAFREGETYQFLGKQQIVFNDWKTIGDEYWVQVLGDWYKIGKEGEANIIHNNPTGRAIVWIFSGNYMSPLGGGEAPHIGESILCFSPGTQI